MVPLAPRWQLRLGGMRDKSPEFTVEAVLASFGQRSAMPRSPRVGRPFSNSGSSRELNARGIASQQPKRGSPA